MFHFFTMFFLKQPASFFSFLHQIHLVVCLLSQIQTDVASMFVTTHQSVAQMSSRMKLELRRHNYVTPTNYLELVSGYKK